ncbi:MAG: hypothetical protein IIA45_07760 [Bacteroidetes bacterium]|nr:hypothetical protein [Bacteroidota bacterium]
MGAVYSTKFYKFSIRVGLSLLLIAILSNEWLLSILLSSDNEIHPINKVKIRVFELCCLLLASLFLALRKNSRQLSRIIIATSSVLLMVLVIEVVFHFMMARSNDYEVIQSQQYVVRDSKLGYKLKNVIGTLITKKSGNDIIYDVSYNIDHGMRITKPKNLSAPSAVINMLGCSVLFGTGLNDDQTIASQLSAITGREVKNYGVEGYGTQQIHSIIKNNPEMNNSGLALYIFTNDHVSRVIGTMEVYNSWGREMPYFKIADAELEYAGNFQDDRPYRAWVYQVLGKSSIVKYFKLNFPSSINDSHLFLTFKLMEVAHLAYEEGGSTNSFYVIFYPGSSFSRELIPLLEEAEISYLDYSDLFDRRENKFHIPGDGHPSRYANQILAQQIARDLDLK